jgi:hypothetical protein
VHGDADGGADLDGTGDREWDVQLGSVADGWCWSVQLRGLLFG